MRQSYFHRLHIYILILQSHTYMRLKSNEQQWVSTFHPKRFLPNLTLKIDATVGSHMNLVAMA